LVSLVIDHGGGARRGLVVGRDPELAVLEDLLSGDMGSGAVLMVGGAGIGKTTLRLIGDAIASLLDQRPWRVRAL
jgi:hypothetical protein